MRNVLLIHSVVLRDLINRPETAQPVTPFTNVGCRAGLLLSLTCITAKRDLRRASGPFRDARCKLRKPIESGVGKKRDYGMIGGRYARGRARPGAEQAEPIDRSSCWTQRPTGHGEALRFIWGLREQRRLGPGHPDLTA